MDLPAEPEPTAGRDRPRMSGGQSFRAWIAENRLVIAVLGGSAVLGFVAVGLLSADSRFASIDLTGFDQGSALVFLAAWGQLILAIAIWDQIRSARATADATEKNLEISATAADAAKRSADSAAAAVVIAARERERAAVIEIARTLTEFVGRAAVAAGRYEASAEQLQPIAQFAGERLRASRAAAASLVDTLERVTDEAVAQYEHVLASAGPTSNAEKSAAAFRDAIVRKRSALQNLMHSNPPNRADVEILRSDTKALLEACIIAARDLRATVDATVDSGAEHPAAPK